MSKSLFDPVQVGAWKLSSRVVMAPLTRNRAPGGIPTPIMASYYGQRANPASGAGLIVSEGTPVCAQGYGYSDTPGIHSPEQVEAWKQVTAAVHAQGGHIVCQLWHVGRISHVELQPGGQAPVAPSAVRAHAKCYLIKDENGQRSGGFVDCSAPRALDIDEIAGVVESFAQGARNAIAAGFDGVEIHGANGYLLDQFLREESNRRTDGYGGSIANRCRLLIEVVRACCEAIGGDRVGLRLSPVMEGNGAVCDPQVQAIHEHLVRELAPLGLAYLHLIEGQTGGARDHQPFDYAALRAAYRAAGGQGAWMVNNGYDRQLAEQSLAEGADLVAFGKAFIANPDLGERLRRGGPFNEPDRATFYGGGAAEQGYTDYPALA
jgi:N-ethylmaleimide reductase